MYLSDGHGIKPGNQFKWTKFKALLKFNITDTKAKSFTMASLSPLKKTSTSSDEKKRYDQNLLFNFIPIYTEKGTSCRCICSLLQEVKCSKLLVLVILMKWH